MDQIRAKTWSVLGLIHEASYQEGLRRLEGDFKSGVVISRNHTLIRAVK